MLQSAPQVSFILLVEPHHAHTQTIIDSIKSQQFSEYECIIAGANISAEQWGNIRQAGDDHCFYLSTNGETARFTAWQRAMQMARGKYIAFVPANCALPPEWCMQMWQYFFHHDNVALAYSHIAQPEWDLSGDVWFENNAKAKAVLAVIDPHSAFFARKNIINQMQFNEYAVMDYGNIMHNLPLFTSNNQIIIMPHLECTQLGPQREKEKYYQTWQKLTTSLHPDASFFDRHFYCITNERRITNAENDLRIMSSFISNFLEYNRRTNLCEPLVLAHFLLQILYHHARLVGLTQLQLNGQVITL